MARACRSADETPPPRDKYDYHVSYEAPTPEPRVGEADLETLARELLNRIFDLSDPELVECTPRRFVKMLEQMATPIEFKFTTFTSDTDDMVVLSPIPFYTLCEHHVVPFWGMAHIGYVPDGRIAGLSKFPRLVKQLAKGLHTQEHLTSDVADAIEEVLNPRGVAVVIKAEHMCMAMRGVEVANVKTTTSVMRGVFADHNRLARQEFLHMIGEVK